MQTSDSDKQRGLIVSTSQLFCITVVLVFLVVAAQYAGWAAALVSTYVVTLAGITTPLYSMAGGSPLHVGIARSAPTIWLSDVILVAAIVAIWAQGGRLKGGWLLASFIVPALMLMFVVWENTPEQWSGLKLYATALVSFGIGRWISQNLTDKAALVLACACLAACVVQFIITIAQSRGLMLIRAGDVDSAGWINSGRMVGLYSHPSVLGKTMFLLFCFLLPLAASKRGLTRNLAYLAMTVGTIATLLTLSRANTVAIVAAIILWMVFSGRATSITTRLTVLVGAVLVAAVEFGAIAALQSRQDADPQGGYRDPIFSVGMYQIHNSPFTGTGPNYYTEVVGRYDHFAASGYPLHNSFLFPVAELGIPLAVVLFMPLLATIVGAAKSILQTRKIDIRSAALLSILPGFIAIGWTGWGLVATEALPLLFMGFGFLSPRTDMFSVAGDASNGGEFQKLPPYRKIDV